MSSTRPASESTAQERDLARWYEFFLDICHTAKRRNYGIACHPDQKHAMQDMMERVYEDPAWKGGALPPLLVHSGVEPGTFSWVDDSTLELISFRVGLQSARGLGRFKKTYTPDEALKRMG